MYWVGRTYTEYPMVYKKSLPDTLSWREKLGFNEKYVEYYLEPATEIISSWCFLDAS